MTAAQRLPMFPLGSVLFPNAPLPLHVFEPRYQRLVIDCLGSDSRFGVVLIERGFEVGGGDQRFDTGTVAEIVEAAELGEGRWALICIGRERFDVQEWLPDDPYPQALVRWREEEGPEPAHEQVEEVRRLLASCAAMRAELGEPAPPAVVRLDSLPTIAVWQLCTLAPIGPLDDLHLLRIDSAPRRLSHLGELLTEERAVLARRLAGGQE